MRLTGLAPFAAALAAFAVALWFGFAPSSPAPALRLSAGAPGGEYLQFAESLAALGRGQSEPISITVLESAGAVANAAAVARGEADLGLVQSDTPLPPDVMAVAALFPEVLHVVARREAGVTGFASLAAKRVALMPEGSGTNAVFLHIAAHYGLGPGDFDLRPMPPAAAAAALRAGDVDAMVRMIALGADAMRELLLDEALDLVPLDQAHAVELFAPALIRVQVPRGALSGRPARPAADIEAVGVRAVLVAAEEAPADAVRTVTAMIFESRNQLLALDPQTALIAPPSSLSDLWMPVHPGAKAYFDADEPPFLVHYAEPIALAVSVSVLAASAAWQFRRWLEERRKNRGDAYNLELLAAIDEVRLAPDIARLAALEERLFGVFRRVVVDIDEDRVARESIPTFDFVWRSAVDVLGQRRVDLRATSAAAPGSGGALERGTTGEAASAPRSARSATTG